MAETTSGLRSVLSRPAVYELWAWLVGGSRGRHALVREHVRPRDGARVLDLGCGPGELVPHLGNARYVGVDASAAYIERARRVHGDRAEFRLGDATELDDDLRGFDLVLAFGLIHHLDDEGARAAYREAAEALAPGGRFVSVDPALMAGQPRLARLVISADRGQHVRAPDEYARLAGEAFTEVRTTV